MFAWPQSDAISRQQAASSAVVTAPGSMQAKTGDPANKQIMTKTPTLLTRVTALKVYKSCLIRRKPSLEASQCGPA